jgi:pimeloyl-ACP methyl ester carboxylesterase
MNVRLRPFRVDVPEDALRDLRARIDATRWPAVPTGAGWELGVDQDVLREACDHWRTNFDWREHERWLNQHRGFLADVDGTTVHAFVADSSVQRSLPLVLLHGWPSTMSEFRHIVEPLTNPSAFGGERRDAFDVVVVSLPGYGFSGPTRSPGCDADRMARAIAALLRELGIHHYGVFGTDAGAYVATSLAAMDGDAVIGLHLHLGGVSLARQARADPALSDQPTEQERRAFDALARYEATDSAYSMINATKPYTLAYALNDSPVGQAAWILEKFHTWTDSTGFDPQSAPFGAVSVDDALAVVTTYWLTGTSGSAARFYADAGATLARCGLPRVEVPTGCAVFPGDIVVPSRRWAERSYPNVTHWTEMPRGGHFSALEEPDLLVDDLRAFFRDAGV